MLTYYFLTLFCWNNCKDSKNYLRLESIPSLWIYGCACACVRVCGRVRVRACVLYISSLTISFICHYRCSCPFLLTSIHPESETQNPVPEKGFETRICRESTTFKENAKVWLSCRLFRPRLMVKQRRSTSPWCGRDGGVINLAFFKGLGKPETRLGYKQARPLQ